MILERVEIVGFRGINRLSLMLEQNNVLIGENAWGKSSLLDALTLLLSPESDRSHRSGRCNGHQHADHRAGAPAKTLTKMDVAGAGRRWSGGVCRHWRE